MKQFFVNVVHVRTMFIIYVRNDIYQCPLYSFHSKIQSFSFYFLRYDFLNEYLVIIIVIDLALEIIASNFDLLRLCNGAKLNNKLCTFVGGNENYDISIFHYFLKMFRNIFEFRTILTAII